MYCNQNNSIMTIELAKELIRERLEQKPVKGGWINEFSDDAFYGESKKCSLLPASCGEHHETVYNKWGTPCNSICYRHFRKDECLHLDDTYAALHICLVTGPSQYEDDQERIEEARKHVGEIYVTFDKPINRGSGTVYFYDYGKDLSLDDLAQQHPEFLKELVFHLK